MYASRWPFIYVFRFIFRATLKLIAKSIFILPTAIVGTSVIQTSIAQGRTFNWNDCVSLAEQNNTEIRQAKEKLTAAQYLVRSAQSGFYPKIYGSLSHSSSYLANTGQSDTAQMNLSLSQNLFSGFSDLSKSDIAKQNALTAQISLQQTKLSAIENLKIAYSKLVYAQDYLKLVKRIEARRSENYKMVELRYNSGRENKGSLLLSEAYHHQAKYDILLAQSQINISQEELKKILGLEDQEQLEVTSEDTTSILLDPNPEFQTLALKNYDYQKTKSDEIVSQLNLKSAKSGFSPSLDLSASTGKTDSTWTPNQNKWSAGLTLTIPLFDGLKDYSSAQAQAASAKAAELLTISTRQEIVTKLKQAYADLKISQEKLKVDHLFQKASLTRSEIARKKYNNGLMSFEEWDQVENDLILREKNLLSSQRDFWKAYASWTYMASQNQEVTYE
ncbi:MAG: hypothetical protein BroJett040_20050 [Oligoflexia bacterium]|nr:MAG: hypothetical protein BroJett040_20050 [Oligoflexia bacterium]